MLSILIQASGLGISAALSPGPFQALIIAQSLRLGWRKTLPIIFAPLLGDIPIALILVFFLRQVPEAFLRFVSIAGAILLLFFAWNMYRSINEQETFSEPDELESRTIARGLTMGVSMLFLSPGPYIYWSLVLGPLLLEALEIGLFAAISFLFAFYLFSIGGLILLSVLLTRLGTINDLLQKRMRIFSIFLMLGIALVLFVRVLQA